jgi:NCS1 family nucleobase:cation symporter-1
MANAADRGGQIERHAIEQVPAAERHGKPWHLFTLWFSCNVQVTALVTGALAIVLGLDLKWAVICIITGNLIGGVFMAYHSIQGPRMGVPQMVQSRAQFGVLGNVLPLIIVLLMYMGFAIEGGVIAGPAIAGFLHIPNDLAITLFNVVLLLVAFFGYNLIHVASRIIAVISGLACLALFIELLMSLPAQVAGTAVNAGNILLVISIFVSWQITWAPYVSDYSRYLPESTSPKSTFWWTYLGSAVGAIFVMIVGAFGAAVSSSALNADPIGFLAHRFPLMSALMIPALLLGLVPAGAEGPYSAFLTCVSGISPKGKLRSPVMGRAVFIIGFTIIVTVLAITASSNVLGTVENITLFLLYLLAPWTAINLTDYYFIRHGHYDIPALFEITGKYGAFNWGAIAIYIAAIAFEMPFVNSSLYVGPMVNHLGGADISWLVGLVVAGGAYYLYASARQRRHGSGLSAGLNKAAS